MSQLSPFMYNNTEVRAREEDGTIIFVAKDVAPILGYERADSMTRYLDEDEKGLSKWRTLGGEQNMSHVTEEGLYSAIMRSTSEQAKPFRRWVTHEVLPAIRRHGAYMTDHTLEEALTSPDFLIQLATQLKTEREARQAAEATIQAQAPKVLFADSVATAETSILVGELAKILKGNGINIGQNRLFAWMRTHGYLISGKRSDYNMPTQRAMEDGLFEIKETSITHADGHVTVNRTPKVTGRGQQYFIDLFLGQDELEAAE
ncbi:MAG: phage antirepressor KilAC domain-containing protein [Actinomycetaceae bacterium]|nr:phage antirepressor KilAC domain-containing protein [Actinomycetaceae bacterium]MDY6082558.1 phage antirepressor KilAC domain-containing protein [Actinomycetaceae bacterium]